MKGRVVVRGGKASGLAPLEPEPILLFTGTHELSHLRRTSTPLFVSRSRFFDGDGRELRNKPRALGPWALDSGGFTEILQHGRWTLSPRDYARFVARVVDEVGNLLWAAPQDWMCEPPALARSGMTAREHQQLTVENFVELKSIAPDLPIIPVLQGFWGTFLECSSTQGERWRWDPVDPFPNGPGAYYADHVELYDKAGVDLREYPLVGIGSICRRGAEFPFFLNLQRQLAPLVRAGVRFHAFGFKTTALAFTTNNDFIASVDSLAWSYGGRNAKERLVPWHRDHTKCANCLEALLLWRARILTQYPWLRAPLPEGVPLVEELPEWDRVMSPRFVQLMDTFRRSRISEDALRRLDDYPLDSAIERQTYGNATADDLLAALPEGIYLPPAAA